MQHREAGKPHFAARIPAEFLNFLKIRKSKAKNQDQPEASGVWLWFLFVSFGYSMVLLAQSYIEKELLQILMLLQQPLSGDTVIQAWILPNCQTVSVRAAARRSEQHW
ncbi:MAG: hypothetical protein IJQ02_00360, partial [Oscillospiraceae bacterium]|nr:hypothetical protein [Oscillospiraceae bacterium]